MKKNIYTSRVITIFVVCSIFFNGCSKTEVVDEPEADEVQVVSENMHPAGIETVYVDEEYQKEIDKYAEEQIEVEKEKDESLTNYSNDDEETEKEKNSIWQKVYNSAVWSSYTKSQYFSGSVKWEFSDMGDHVSIISTHQDKMTEIMYYKYTNLIDISVTDTKSGYEIESYTDPRQLQTFDFTAQKDFEKMRMIITGKNFLDITEIKVINDKTQKEYLPDDNEYHEIDEAVFVIEDVSKGDKITCNILTTENVTDIRTCAVEYNESAMVNSKR